MVEGSCLCGAVRFRADGEIVRMAHCHCSLCRKSTGAAYATWVAVPSAGFHWIAGEDDRGHHESSPGVRRSFCRSCGSRVPTAPPGVAEVFVPAGMLDGTPAVPRARHIFVGSKAPWFEIGDDLEQHDEYPRPAAG